MHKYKFIRLLVVAALALLTIGCKTDFNPNAEWREVPVVYCLIDQDDSVSYVRVQKCFLGDGDLTAYASVMDSSNYAAGELKVQMLVWNSADDIGRDDAAPIRVLDFDYAMSSDKASGLFYSPNQPIYRHVNQTGDFAVEKAYQLVVSKAASGALLARAVTTLVDNPASEIWLSTPHPTSPGRAFAFRTGNACQIEWHAFGGGRRYQPSLTFLYRHRYEDKSNIYTVDVPLDYVVSNLSDPTLSVSIGQATFLATVGQALQSDTAAKSFCDTVAISLAVCNEPLHAYLNAVNMMTHSSEQDLQMYTNIEGGLGVFASRRTHLRILVPSDKSDAPTGLHTLLEQLQVGFEQE